MTSFKRKTKILALGDNKQQFLRVSRMMERDFLFKTNKRLKYCSLE